MQGFFCFTLGKGQSHIITYLDEFSLKGSVPHVHIF
jgi:hypothetical protein